MNGPRTRLLVSILALVVLLAPMARAQTFGVPCALERAVHFPTADGRIVLMEAGSYLLEQEGLNLRLRPAAGGEGLLLQSSVMAHDKTVAGPVALSIPGRGAYPDIHMVVLLLPAGEGLRAFGSYSGVMPRGFGSWISDRIDDATDVVEDVVDVVDDVTDDVVDVVDDAADVVVDGVVDGAEWAYDQVDDAFDAAMDAALDAFDDVVPGSRELLEDAGSLFEEAMVLTYGVVTDPERALALAEQAAELTAQALEDSWNAAVDAAAYLYEEAQRFLKEMICKAMVYMFQGMDLLSKLSGPAAEALAEVTAPINSVIQEVVDETVERVGAEETMQDIENAMRDGVQELIPQFSVVISLLEEVEYSRQQLDQLQGIMLSTSVCELSRDELEAQMRDILDPLYARLVTTSSQSAPSWPEFPVLPPSDDESADEADGEVVEIPPAPVPLTVEVVPTSSHPSIPAGLKATFLNAEGTSSSTTCPVIRAGSLTCWAYSYLDNRTALAVVAYDDAGNVIKQWEKSGARYLSRIVLHPASATVELVGQADRTVTMAWDEITAVVPPPPPEPAAPVVAEDRPPEASEPVPTRPAEEPAPVQAETDAVPTAPAVAVADQPATVKNPPAAAIDVPGEAPQDVLEQPAASEKTPQVAATTAAAPSPASGPTISGKQKPAKQPPTSLRPALRPRRRGEGSDLDQDWTPRTREGRDIRAGATLAQTFTAGRAGLLSSIALRINRRAWTNSDLTVDIRRVLADGVPVRYAASALFTTTLPPETFPLAFSEALTAIDVRSAGIAVQPGDLLAVTVTNPGATNYVWWDLEGYDGGRAFGFENGDWIGTGSDLVFQAEVDADAPLIATRGEDTRISIDEMLTSVFGYETVFTDIALNRPVERTDGGGIAPDTHLICLGGGTEIEGVTIWRNQESRETPTSLCVEVFESYEDIAAGNTAFVSDVWSRREDDTVKVCATFDLREENVKGRYVRILMAPDSGTTVDRINVWSSRGDWSYGYAGIQISGSGFLAFLHPALKIFAISGGFGTALPCCSLLTNFGGGITSGDPSFEIAGQIGWFQWEPGEGNSLSVSVEAEMLRDFFPENPAGTFVASAEGVVDRLENLPWNKAQLAVHLDFVFDADLLWSFLFEGNSCLRFYDVLQGIVLTFGPEWEGVRPTTRFGGDISGSFGRTWEGLFGL